MIWLLACTAAPPGDSGTPPGDSADVPVGDGTCALSERVGIVRIEGGAYGSASVQVWDRPNPKWGEPALENDHCAFHQAVPCGDCDGTQVCGADGQCVDPPILREDVQATALVDGERVPLESQGGGLWVSLDEGAEYGVEVVVAGETYTMDGLALPSGEIAPSVATEGDYDQPGALSASWTDRGEGALVSTWIDINHHVFEETFTTCTAPESAGSFTADAAMIDPLAVSTGLEFQGLTHERRAELETADGCVQVVVLTDLYVSPE